MITLVLITETEAHEITKILKNQSSIVGVKAKVRREFWRKHPAYESLPEWVEGTIRQWFRVKESKITFDWPDGFETELLSELLAPAFEFQLIANANGGPPPRLRGAQAPPRPDNDGTTYEKITIPYKVGVINREQVWEVRRFHFLFLVYSFRAQNFARLLDCFPSHSSLCTRIARSHSLSLVRACSLRASCVQICGNITDDSRRQSRRRV